MTSKIRVLDDHTVNQIAAGEVIENPASVVKELVENSIDAGATEIAVDILGGGRQLIRVSDNGCGMRRDDAILSIERHATSKIKSIEDLHEMLTMGFRGEALPSVASISKFTLTTRPHDSEEGTILVVEGGKQISCASTACNAGTSIEVKSLFFNVPVRKKFQRSPAYDTSEVQKVLTLQALVHPEIKFSLSSNDKRLLQVKETEMEGRIREVLGKDFFSTLMPVKAEKGAIRLSGFIGMPGFSRHNRSGQYLFINKRSVFSPLFSHTVRESYGTALATNRHPVFVLYLDLPASMVDPNVHPQKREVRLRQEEDLRDMIREAVGNAMQTEGGPMVTETVDPYFSYYGPPKMMREAHAPFYSAYQMPRNISEPVISPQPYVEKDPGIENNFFEEPKKVPHVLATIKGFVLLESSNDGVKLLDQKAAHSRVIYDKLEKTAKQQTQTLLVPYTLELTPPDAEMVREYLKHFQQMGIQIEEFGANGFIIHAIPPELNGLDFSSFIEESVESMRKYQDDSTIAKEIRKKIAMAASRASVSSVQRLSYPEAESLVRELYKNPKLICPLGKPIAVDLSPEKLKEIYAELSKTC